MHGAGCPPAWWRFKPAEVYRRYESTLQGLEVARGSYGRSCVATNGEQRSSVRAYNNWLARFGFLRSRSEPYCERGELVTKFRGSRKNRGPFLAVWVNPIVGLFANYLVADRFIWLGFLWSVSYTQLTATHGVFVRDSPAQD